MCKGPDTGEPVCVEEAKRKNNLLPLEHRRKEKMGKCEGVFESTDSRGLERASMPS